MESVIEIGVGGEPYFIRYQIPCPVGHYVGVDKDEGRLKEARTKYGNDASTFLAGDATKLPFEDETFDMAVLSNILSAPIHHDWDQYAPEHTVRGFGENDLFYRERKRVVDEALRVLRPGGKLVIYTDLLVYGAHAYDAVIRELEGSRHGFRAVLEEQARIDALNETKVRSGEYCHCFLADLLPASSVYEITKTRP